MATPEQVAPAATEYCWSLDGEGYNGPCDSIDQAISEALQHEEVEVGRVIHLGRVKPIMEYLRKRGLAKYLVEDLDNDLCDDIAWDDAMVELASEHCRELDELILDYLEKHASFNCWGVERLREHTVTAEDLA